LNKTVSFLLPFIATFKKNALFDYTEHDSKKNKKIIVLQFIVL